MEFNAELVQRIMLTIPALLVSASFHEFAHGFVAYRMGDSTAKNEGRLTLNPIKHIDPIGTILVPFVLSLSGFGFFGWAKPVPVNPYNLRDPKTGMAWVALAGPLTNFMLVFSTLFFLVLVKKFAVWGVPGIIIDPFFNFLLYMVIINVVLGVFNLIPIPPLDGGRIAVGLLPNDMAGKWAALEPYGMFIIMGLVFLDPLGIWSVSIRGLLGMVMELVKFVIS